MPSTTDPSRSDPQPVEVVAQESGGSVKVTPAVENPERTSDQPAGRGGREPSVPSLPLNPGDEAAPGSVGTGETFCPVCGGSGRLDDAVCKACGGTGQVTVAIGGA